MGRKCVLGRASTLVGGMRVVRIRNLEGLRDGRHGRSLPRGREWIGSSRVSSHWGFRFLKIYFVWLWALPTLILAWGSLSPLMSFDSRCSARATCTISVLAHRGPRGSCTEQRAHKKNTFAHINAGFQRCPDACGCYMATSAFPLWCLAHSPAVGLFDSQGFDSHDGSEAN